MTTQDNLRTYAGWLNQVLQESSNILPDPNYPGQIEEDWPVHCSANNGCEQCEYYDREECPGN